MTRMFAGIVTATLVGVLAVSSPARATVNLASSGTAYASSQVYGAPNLAIDGDTSTTYDKGSIFESGMDDVPWWFVDLGADHELGKVRIFGRTEEDLTVLRDFTVTVFSALGAVTYSNAFATNPGEQVLTPFDVLFTQAVLGRYVEVVLNHKGYLALAEVQVTSAAAENVSVPEPATMGLMLFGLVGAVAARRRAHSGLS